MPTRSKLPLLITAVLIITALCAAGGNAMDKTADNPTNSSRLFMPNIWAAWLPDKAAADAFADACKERSLNGCGMQIWWDQIEPKKGEFDWTWLDERLDAMVAKGLRVHLRFATQQHRPEWFKAELQQEADGKLVEIGGMNLVSFADLDAQHEIADTITHLAKHVMERYADVSPQPIAFILVQCSGPAETEYAHDRWSDFAPAAQSDFRDWLKTRFESVVELNSAWGTRFASWDQITLQAAHPYDFNAYRTHALARAIGIYADAIHSAPGAQAGVQFGSIWDGLSTYRGTRDVRPLIDPVEWIVVDDYPLYDHAYSMDHLRGQARDKMWGNEVDGPGILPNERGLEQCITSARRGAKFLFAANWNTKTILDRKWTFWEDVMKELQKPAPEVKPTKAIVASLASVYRLTPDQGVDALYHNLYKRLSDNSKNPIDILTDTVILEHPEWLNQYTDGLYISASQLRMTDHLVAALAKCEVPVYAEDERVGMLDQYDHPRGKQPSNWITEKQ